MKWNSGPNYSELQRRLYTVLPEYPPISTYRESKPGTYKAIDASGAVWLVTLGYNEAGNFTRYQTQVMTPEELTLKAGTAPEPGRMKADEGWNLGEKPPSRPVVERYQVNQWYDKD